MPSIDKFDAIIFNHHHYKFTESLKQLPHQDRDPHQRYVFLAYESAHYFPVKTQEEGFYNWTISYRRDSDFQVSYGQVVKKHDHPTGNELKSYIREFGQKNRHLAANRTGFKAAWFVSNCHSRSRREKVVEVLQRHMEVDIYGKCGKFKCSKKTVGVEKCFANMAKKYKFYLSFENSLCEDYATEKFFYILFYNVIPLTLGGGPYDKMAPPHSYINVLDFNSVRHLANHLKELHEDDAKYAEYFWWKDFYTARTVNHSSSKSYCELCHRLNDPADPPHVYNNLRQWWDKGSNCRRIISADKGEDGVITIG